MQPKASTLTMVISIDIYNLSHALREQDIFIPSPVGPLQAKWAVQQSNTTVFVLHPHPGHLGSMDNKVVTSMIKVGQSCGFNTLRFNFRGVGKSSGTINDGSFDSSNEQQDMEAVWRWLQSNTEMTTKQFLLCGFSFGSHVAMQHALKHNINNVLVVAPPLARLQFQQRIDKVAVIQGESDELVDCNAVKQWAQSYQYHFQSVDAGHFFHGKLPQLKAAVQSAWQHFAVL